MWTRSRIGRASVKTAAAVGAASLSLFGGVTAANAAPGDVSNASGTFLGGSILSLIDLDDVVLLEGATATNGGTEETVTDYNTLDLTAVGVVNVTAPGGVQVPIDLGSLGVVGQYASADPDGSSVGASGAVGSGGIIGTGAPATGPLSLSLGGAVDTLAGSVAAELVDEITGLDLTLGAVSARAAQDAPADATSSYTIAGGQLVIDSATLSALTAELNTAVGGLQASLDNVDGLVNGGVASVLGALGVQANLSVGTTSLTGAISGLLTGQITSDEYPGVVIDLGTGEIIVDLDEIGRLNNLPAGAELLGAQTLPYIQDAVVDAVTGLTDRIDTAVLNAVRGISVTGGVVIPPILITPQVPVLSVNTTIGQLLDGDTSGIVVLGGITLPVGLGAVAGAILAPVQAIVANVGAAVDVVVTPVTTVLSPALGTVLPAVASVTVNNQATSAEGVFSITGAIITVLPGSIATTIELANATVGPNALDDNADVTITTPETGDEFVVPGPDDVSDVTVTGTGEPDAVITVSIPGQGDQVVTVTPQGTWTAVFTDLPVGDYTATATQDADGTTATVDFSVVEAPDVVITAPTPDQIFVVPGVDDTTDVTVTGTGFPGSNVDVEIGGTIQTVPVGPEGTWTATFTDLPIGDYSIAATQEFDGSTDTLDFSIAETPDVVIEEPVDGTEIAIGQIDGVATVTVSGTASPDATVTVELDNGATETTTAAADGTWSVDFADLPIADYTATATQDADDSVDTVSFSVVLAEAVEITAPIAGTEYEVGEPDATRSVTVTGTGQAGAEVTVSVPTLGAQTATVTSAGLWSVVFADVPVGDFSVTAVQDIDGSIATTSFSVTAVAADADADVLDADVLDIDADADVLDADADVLDIDADADVLDADADVLDIDADVADIDIVDADADVLDADADVLDIDVDADVLDADADVLDIDADVADIDIVDADADVLDADADVLDIDADADVLDADADVLDIDADADVLDADADVLDIDADADVLDIDADVADIDIVDADADVLDADADALDIDADVLDIDADVLDADADVLDADADVLDIDADVLDIDADADVLDADATDADATDADATDADATDADATDADATDADATDADATDADATDGDVTVQARADVLLPQIVRGIGVSQTVVVQGFQPGETVSATVNSTPFELAPVTADAAGSARMTFEVGADFELGAHRVEVRGAVTGELPTERENTAFTVTAQPAAAGNGGGSSLPATGVDLNGPLVGGLAAALIVAGATLWTLRRRSASGEQR
ncbi:choice-of-anchor G family protein [Microbacterium testaceum]|uniref:choice-of-anchor G family protein n=1 Tax=Microbacterium testaceum TaxID=2033 RepID=UPI002AC57634|nr:choice-of-anchor G family protein [Microbacterium testaceum]MDZ5145840.1 choice-of-anchor G family protein [Microbacterium testaceum]